jgi:hypothetical protein
MTTWWEKLGRLLRSQPRQTQAKASAAPPAPQAQLPEVSFEVTPHVSRLLERGGVSPPVRISPAIRRGLAIGLRGALAVLPARSCPRAEAIAMLRAHAQGCRAACERGLALLLNTAGETHRALAWLAWALDAPVTDARAAGIATVVASEAWAARLPAASSGPCPLVVWDCADPPGREVARAASEARLLLLTREGMRGDQLSGWCARGGYVAEDHSLSGLEIPCQTHRLSATAACVQALLAGVGPSGWWEVRPPMDAKRADAVSGLRALREALASRVIAMVPREAGSQTMVIPPLFQGHGGALPI